MIHIEELVKAHQEDRLIEMFGCGTAAVVSPVCEFMYKNEKYPVPINEEMNAGELTTRIANMLTDI